MTGVAGGRYRQACVVDAVKALYAEGGRLRRRLRRRVARFGVYGQNGRYPPIMVDKNIIVADKAWRLNRSRRGIDRLETSPIWSRERRMRGARNARRNSGFHEKRFRRYVITTSAWGSDAGITAARSEIVAHGGEIPRGMLELEASNHILPSNKSLK